jgi:hypothetical protein
MSILGVEEHDFGRLVLGAWVHGVKKGMHCKMFILLDGTWMSLMASWMNYTHR